MTCQDCIHHNVCYYAGRLKTKDSDGEKRIIAETNNVEDTCENFQDRSLLVKPPCKVGDTVYVIYDGYVTCAYVLAFYIDKDGGMLDLLITTKEEYAVGFKKVIDKNYTFSDIFLTLEEEERVLEGREKNG